VNILHVRLEGRGTSATLESRDVGEDWAAAAAPTFKRARRQGHDAGVRLEWIGDTTSDPFMIENPAPPAWVDAITPTDGDALVRLRLRRGAGGDLLRVELEIRDEAGDLTSRALQRSGLGAIVTEVERILGAYAVSRVLGTAWRREVHRPGRGGRPDVFYAEKAAAYVAAHAAESRAPVRYLVEQAEREGRERETADQWRAWLNRARARGLLTKAPPGQPGGRLTAKGKRLLRDAGIGGAG